MDISYLIFDGSFVQVPNDIFDSLITSFCNEYFIDTVVSPDDSVILTDFFLRKSAFDKPLWFARSGIDI